MGDMDEYIFDEDGMPVLRSPSEVRPDEKFADEEDVTNLIHQKGAGFDVTLSLSRGLITWTPVSPGGKKKGIFKGKKQLNKLTVMLKDVFGVKIKRRRTAGQEEGEGTCLGFTLYVVDTIGPSCISDRIILFEHPSDSLCSMYVSKVEKYLNEIKGRPKNVKLYLQGHAGSKNGQYLFKSRVKPLFEVAEVSCDCVELHHNEQVKQDMAHINLSDFECVIAMGGDGTVNCVVDCLLSKVQKDRDIEQKPGFTPVRSTIPVGIIPVGSTNNTARTVMGTDDLVTAVLHIIMGHKQIVDVCSSFCEDKFFHWCFNSQYGFAGNVLAFRKRYKAVGRRGLELAFVKALTKAKLRSYKCDIEYIPAEPISQSRKFLPCYKGCDVCWDEKLSEDEVTSDLVEAFDPLAMSGDSDTLVDLAQHEDTPWKTVKGDFMNIGLFTNSGHSELSPRGLSKYTHLNDGTADLVLIKETDRKEFMRVLKRLGNSKNQFDFPFVDVIRVKEIRFRVRLPTGFNYNDYSFSELDYELSRQEKLKQSSATKTSEILEIDDCISDESEDEVETVEKPATPEVKTKQKPHPMKRSDTFHPNMKKKELKRTNTEISMDLDFTDSDDDDDDDDSEKEDSESVVINGYGVRTVRSSSAPAQKLVGPQYRMSFADMDRAKRRKRAQKKEEKKKAKDEERMKTVWNIDNDIQPVDTIDFKVHHGLLKICGQGIDPDNVYNENSLLCIPRL